MKTYEMSVSEYMEDCIEIARWANELGLKYIYGIPRAGSRVCADVCANDESIVLRPCNFPGLDHPRKNDVLIVDDVVDSGKTLQPYLDAGYNCAVLCSKRKDWNTDLTRHNFWWGMMLDPGDWFQSEHDKKSDETDMIRRLLQYIGEDPDREGLQETPKRVLKAYKEWFSGYGQDPKDLMKVFEDDTSDEIVMLKDIEFTSFCEHHMAPFIGKAHIAYIPDGRVLGASKLARLLDVYARRLQIQERIAQQVVDALEEHLQPKGAACYIEAKHLCISSRGVAKQHSVFVTSALTGEFKTNALCRNEFMCMIK